MEAELVEIRFGHHESVAAAAEASVIFDFFSEEVAGGKLHQECESL